MSESYILKLQEGSIQDLIAATFGAGLRPADNLDMVQSEHLLVAIQRVRDGEFVWQLEDFGIAAIVEVIFYVKDPLVSRAKSEIVSIVKALLEVVSGDATLFQNYEIPVLRRTGGVLSVEEESGWWTPSLRKALLAPS